jgi:transcription initiation factor TFIIIB Brf1 subunit/transcription initiation factor TFIIB
MSDDLFAEFISDSDTESTTAADFTPESCEDNCRPVTYSDNSRPKISATMCLHENTIENAGTVLCVECGEEIEKSVVYDKEWRYYGHMDTKHKTNPNRCQSRKDTERTIFKDVEGMFFEDNVTTIANNFYLQITDGKIHRGESRKGIVFACIYHAYKQIGNPRSCESLTEVFKIERKTGLKGLKHFQLNIDKQSVQNTSQITPANLVGDIMDKFSATPEQKAEVIRLYERIKDEKKLTSKINRARPQSVASGLTYYWICNNNKKITLKEFVSEIGLSELTVDRIAKEFAVIINGATLDCK